MGIQINIAEAKAKLSELVARAEAGEEVVLARGGKPILRLQPLSPPRKRKHAFLGALAHLGPLSDAEAEAFVAPDPALAQAAAAADEDDLLR